MIRSVTAKLDESMGWGRAEAERISHIKQTGMFERGHVLRSLATLFILIKMELAYQSPITDL